MVETPNDQNTLTGEMELGSSAAEEYDIYGNRLSTGSVAGAGDFVAVPTVSAPQINPLSVPYVSKPKVQPTLDKKIVVFDTETTGINPWEYRLLGGSFWELDKPVSTMESFFGFDEEKVTQDIGEYLSRVKPAIMVCFNNGFDQRALLSKFMMYHVKCPGWNGIEQLDMMEILKKGTTGSLYSSQPTGSEEIWLKYFFNESKPYTIDECFEGVRNLNLRPMEIRNRLCTSGVGYMYLLFREVTDEEPFQSSEDKPTSLEIDEEAAKGVYILICNVCGAANYRKKDDGPTQCILCMSPLSAPTEADRVREVIRTFDFTKVGLKEKTA
jgi:hypothetical protein